MAKSKKPSVDRRDFLRGAAVGAAGLVARPPVAMAQTAQASVESNSRPGSDFMVDVIKSLGIEYCAANPGSSFRGLQESFINYGGNASPEWLTCCHEESSVAMAHGYAKIEGKPMMIMAHGTVGLQHASMAIYNAMPTACRSTSCSATFWTSITAAAVPSGITASRMRPPWFAITRSGTTRRYRSRTLQNLPCAPTPSQ